MAFGVLRKPIGAIAALSSRVGNRVLIGQNPIFRRPPHVRWDPRRPWAGLAEQPGQACGGDRPGPRQRRWMVEGLSSRVLARALAGNEFRLCCVTLRHGWSA